MENKKLRSFIREMIQEEIELKEMFANDGTSIIKNLSKILLKSS